MTLDYHHLEEEIFNLLYKKHLSDSSFSFSTRKKSNPNAKYDYFIGSQKSGYFAFTLWAIPVWYKGASIDLIDYIIRIKNNKPEIHFQYYISKFAQEKQNKLNLKFLSTLREEFLNNPFAKYYPQSRGEKFIVVNSHTSTSSNFYDSFLSFIETTSAKIDNAISKFQNQNRDWEAGRINEADFFKNLNILKRRLELNFSNNFEDLLESEEEKVEQRIKSSHSISATAKKTLVDSRRGQGFFRDNLITLWRCCSISKVANIRLLRASHIKPWRISNDEEKLDCYNGLLLLPNYDLLFDKFLISFTDSGNILISNKLTRQELEVFRINDNIVIDIKENNKKYLAYHREQFYLKNQGL